MKVLVLNCGSSSLKYQLIDMETEHVMAKGNVEKVGMDDSFLTHKVNGEKHKIEQKIPNHEEGIKLVIEQLLNPEYGVIKSLDEIDAIGHRIVHGGEKITSSVLITDEVIKGIIYNVTISMGKKGSTFSVVERPQNYYTLSADNTTIYLM